MFETQKWILNLSAQTIAYRLSAAGVRMRFLVNIKNGIYFYTSIRKLMLIKRMHWQLEQV